MKNRPGTVKNISQPADWWAAFQAAAEAEGLPLSAWVGKCCKARLERGTRQALSERPPAHRPKNSEPST